MECILTPACRCNLTLNSSSVEIYTHPLEICDDINECFQPSMLLCGFSSYCQGEIGRTYCTCSHGFDFLSELKKFTEENETFCLGNQHSGLEGTPSVPHACLSHALTATPFSTAWPHFTSLLYSLHPDFDLHVHMLLHTPTHTCTSPNEPLSCPDSHAWQHPVSEPLQRDWAPLSRDWAPLSWDWAPLPRDWAQLHLVSARWSPQPGEPPNTLSTPWPEASHPPVIPHLTSQRLSRFTDKVNNLHKDVKPDQAKDTIQGIMQEVDELLETPGDMETLPPSQKHYVATHLLTGLESDLRHLSWGLPEGTATFNYSAGTQLAVEVQKQGICNVTLSLNQAKMQLNWNLAQESCSTGPSMVGLVSTPRMDKLLAEAPLVLEPEKQVAPHGTHEDLLPRISSVLLSDVVSVFLSSNETQNLSSSVTFTFSHPVTPRHKVLCVFWEDSQNGSHWTTAGCRTVSTRDGSTTCHCTHLSSFAVLMVHYHVQDEDPVLSVITCVGLGVSLLCLVLAALTFLLCRAIQNTSTSLHLQLSLCLLLAHLLFLTAIDRTQPKVLCAVTAGALHYLYLASFTWMLLEGLFLFLTARNLTVLSSSSRNRLMRRLMFPVGYGVPAAIVAVSAAARPHLYGTPARRKLIRENRFLWLGASSFFCMGFLKVNLVFFLMTLWIVKSKLSSINRDVSTLQNTRYLLTFQIFTYCCVILLCVLQVGSLAPVMAYLFTIVNSLQGVFIFLVYCLLSQQVQEQYRTWLKRIRKWTAEPESYTLSSKAVSDAS
uniref:Adhesion G protein-coupled receptor E2-like n=1 Tax=Spermophilus dauricus TaxID=99837 RepID=A0A8C9UUF5_SPEDA